MLPEACSLNLQSVSQPICKENAGQQNLYYRKYAIERIENIAVLSPPFALNSGTILTRIRIRLPAAARLFRKGRLGPAHGLRRHGFEGTCFDSKTSRLD